MSDADTAYELAREKIAEAARTGATELDFRGEAFHALDRVPPEITALTALQTLWLRGTQVTDLAPLQGLTALETLMLDSTQVSDLAPLQGLTALETLTLDSTQVSDLAPLQGLTALQWLDLDSTQVSDLAPLQGLTALQRLALDGTQVSDLAPLQGLTALQTLRLDRTQVSDLAPLQGLTALQTLWLRGTQVSDLAPLQGLTALRALALNSTQVSDLAPLQGLTALQRLTLDRTQVSDLRPISGLQQLGSTERSGLAFSDTPATARDGRLAELAQIEDDQDRTRQTLDYLRSLPPWPDPYTPAATPDGSPPQPIGGIPAPPEQDPALPLIWDGTGFDFHAEHIASDPVTEAALEDLRSLLDVLRRKGNAHDDLYRIAGELQDRSAGEVSDLNMVKLHLSYQKLRRLHKGRRARENPFDDETVSHMEAVFDILPGVTLADENVHTLIKRQEAERAADLSAREDELAAKLLEDAQEPDAPFSPEVKDIAGEVLKDGMDDRLAGARRILSRNIVIATLKFVGHATATGIVGNFAYNNGTDILAYASTMGTDAFVWAQSVMAKFRVEYELAMGISREVVVSPKIRRTKPKPEK